MIDWIHFGTSLLVAFFASLVQGTEVMTLVLAVGMVRSSRAALVGAIGAIALLTGLTVIVGPVLNRASSIGIQATVGVFALLLGMRWLRKAILRATGIVPMRDEKAEFCRRARTMWRDASYAQGWDTIGSVATFRATIRKGLVVAFVIIALGTTGGPLLAVAMSAVAAATLVGLLGIGRKHPLSWVPGNTVKFAVGVLLSAVGIFWIGMGLGMIWPGRSLSVLGIVAALLLAVMLSMQTVRQIRASRARPLQSVD